MIEPKQNKKVNAKEDYKSVEFFVRPIMSNKVASDKIKKFLHRHPLPKGWHWNGHWNTPQHTYGRNSLACFTYQQQVRQLGEGNPQGQAEKKALEIIQLLLGGIFKEIAFNDSGRLDIKRMTNRQCYDACEFWGTWLIEQIQERVIALTQFQYAKWIEVLMQIAFSINSRVQRRNEDAGHRAYRLALGAFKKFLKSFIEDKKPGNDDL